MLRGPLLCQFWPGRPRCIAVNDVNPVSDDFAYSRWVEVVVVGAAAPTVPLEDDCVLMLHPVEVPAFYTLLTITCGAKVARSNQSIRC